MDGPDMLADRVAELARSHAALDFHDAYYAALSRLTLADVNAAAVTFVDADHLTIAVAGPRALLEPTLRAAGLAPVVIVDANGTAPP
jgi:predicted Zn-dependent peptidase